MTTKQLFSGTKPFMLAKLALGGLTVLASVILLAILMGIGWLFGEGGMLITFCIWLAGTGVIRFLIMHYAGYLVKAGHIAVIAEACKRGRLPKNQVAYGKQRVIERFGTSNVYFAIDKLVSSAVKQIQNKIDKLGNKMDFIPGMDAIAGAAKFFVNISLGYIDECCLGWTFYNRDQSAFKSAADAVVIYTQNWKIVLKHAAKTMLKTMLLLLGIVLVSFIPVGIIFKLLKWSPLAAFLLACLIAWVVKFAFIDSYIMIQMMGTYMEVAPETQLSFDLYGKLCGISSSFKELYQKGRQENPGQQRPMQGDMRPRTAAPYPRYDEERRPRTPESRQQYSPSARLRPTDERDTQFQTQQSPQNVAFCRNCGEENAPTAKFCRSCGERLA